jgi:hypothetical protein
MTPPKHLTTKEVVERIVAWHREQIKDKTEKHKQLIGISRTARSKHMTHLAGKNESHLDSIAELKRILKET